MRSDLFGWLFVHAFQAQKVVLLVSCLELVLISRTLSARGFLSCYFPQNFQSIVAYLP